jgi:hypothetical protein
VLPPRFVDNQLENKKTSRVLEAAFGAEWASKYMRTIMFDFVEQVGESLAVSAALWMLWLSLGVRHTSHTTASRHACKSRCVRAWLHMQHHHDQCSRALQSKSGLTVECHGYLSCRH